MDSMLGKAVKGLLAVFLAIFLGVQGVKYLLAQEQRAIEEARQEAEEDFQRRAVTCEDCDGEGGSVDRYGDHPVAVKWTCRTCEGRGKVLPEDLTAEDR